MRCSECQHENTADAEFCASCGSALVQGESTLVHEALAQETPLTPEQAALVADVPSGVGVLVVERGPNAGSRFLLESDETTVGRHPASDVFLDDITVSRRHAAIVREGANYRLHDVGSLNGTYLNNSRVDEVVLRSGDTVQFGRFYVQFLVGTTGA